MDVGLVGLNVARAADTVWATAPTCTETSTRLAVLIRRCRSPCSHRRREPLRAYLQLIRASMRSQKAQRAAVVAGGLTLVAVTVALGTALWLGSVTVPSRVP